MDKEKFEVSKETLKRLLTLQQHQTDEKICEKFDRIIVEVAADLLGNYTFEREEKPVKSEMPCNCKPRTLPENINEIIEKAIEEAETELTDSKTFAAIVFRMD